MAHILVVDDDDIINDFVAETLERAGHRVTQVLDGSMAMTKVDLDRPDLVLLDCSIPDRPGTAILQEIKKDDDYQKIPVIMMTARRSTWSVKLAADLGANGYLKKPFSSQELLEIIEEELNVRGWEGFA